MDVFIARRGFTVLNGNKFVEDDGTITSPQQAEHDLFFELLPDSADDNTGVKHLIKTQDFGNLADEV